MKEDKYPHAELTEKIIGAAMKVHTGLGPGFLEKIYENALLRELQSADIPARPQVKYPVQYNGFLVGQHVLDLVVDGKVYVELKAQCITYMEIAQVLSGLKASKLPVGLLINFNTAHLRDGIKRVVLSEEPSD